MVHDLGHTIEKLIFERGSGCLCESITIRSHVMELDDEYRLEKDLARYNAATMSEAKNIQYLSAVTEKSRVYGMGVANTACATPNNVAWWAPP